MGVLRASGGVQRCWTRFGGVPGTVLAGAALRVTARARGAGLVTGAGGGGGRPWTQVAMGRSHSSQYSADALIGTTVPTAPEPAVRGRPTLPDVDDDEVFDQLTDIEESVPFAEKAERFEELAGTLATGENGRASFLVAAGEHWHMRREYDEARRCFETALADGGATGTSPLANLHSLALETGDEETAAALLGRLRDLARRDELVPSDCLFVAENLETQDRPREALRWFTIPLSRLDPTLDQEDLDPYCLLGRLRVRRQLGLPVDRYDQVALALQAEFPAGAEPAT